MTKWVKAKNRCRIALLQETPDQRLNESINLSFGHFFFQLNGIGVILRVLSRMNLTLKREVRRLILLSHEVLLPKRFLGKKKNWINLRWKVSAETKYLRVILEDKLIWKLQYSYHTCESSLNEHLHLWCIWKQTFIDRNFVPSDFNYQNSWYL